MTRFSLNYTTSICQTCRGTLRSYSKPPIKITPLKHGNRATTAPSSPLELAPIKCLVTKLRTNRNVYQVLLYVNSALTSGRRHSTLNKRTPLNKPIVSIVFLVLLSFCLQAIVVRQLCLLHEVRAVNSIEKWTGMKNTGLKIPEADQIYV